MSTAPSRRLLLLAPAILAGMPFAAAQARRPVTEAEVNRVLRSLQPTGRPPETRRIITIEVRRGREIVRVPVDESGAFDLIVFFEFDSDVVTARARAELAALGTALRSAALGAYRNVIAGHTDATGALDYNLDLSLRRAIAIKAHFVEAFGIHPDRLDVIGFGPTRPKIRSNPRAAENRRVEVLLVAEVVEAPAPHAHPPAAPRPRSREDEINSILRN
jgi:outer membrane protein OmpA-like peptidoglycan-associated protein